MFLWQSNNEVVKLTGTDFRCNRKLHAPDGEVGVRDAFLAQARETLRTSPSTSPRNG